MGNLSGFRYRAQGARRGSATRRSSWFHWRRARPTTGCCRGGRPRRRSRGTSQVPQMPCSQERGTSMPFSPSTSRIDLSGGTVSVLAGSLADDLEAVAHLALGARARREPFEMHAAFRPGGGRFLHRRHQPFRTAAIDDRVLLDGGKALRDVEPRAGFARMQRDLAAERLDLARGRARPRCAGCNRAASTRRSLALASRIIGMNGVTPMPPATKM